MPASLILPEVDGEVKHVAVGERLEIRCEASGTPTPTVYILKDIYDTTWHNQDFGEGTIERRVKMIESAKLTDTGTYVCLASNFLVGEPGGKRKITDWKTIRIEVDGKSTVIVVKEQACPLLFFPKTSN